MTDPMAAGHSPDFVAAWRSAYCGVYGWRRSGRLAVVPTWPGRSVLAYLPGLGYADLNAADARELAREAKGRAHNIRALAEPGTEVRPGAPATLRLDLAGFGGDRAAVWEKALRSSARTPVRRGCEAGLRAGEETGPAALRAFTGLLSATLRRHGAPMPPPALFQALVNALDARVLVVRGRDGQALASALWFLDGALAWVSWIARLPGGFAGDVLCWALIGRALDAGVGVLDFGRSPVGGGSYRFKRKFGAAPVPLLWLSDKPADVYGRYRAAQRLWRALPNAVADAAGPWLCGRLGDY